MNDLEQILVDDLPHDWQIKRFGDFCDFMGGTQPPKSTFVYEPTEGYTRLLQIRDFEDDSNATYIPDNGRMRKIGVDDISIARYGASLGRILTGKEGAINVAIMTTFPDTSLVDKRFLFFALSHRSFYRYLTGLGGRAAQAGFNKGEVTRFRFPLPPLPEQKKIAHILSTVQRAIEAQERIIQTTTELKKALMHKLFTEGLPRRSLGEGGPPRHEPQKQTEIGPVPESWEVVALEAKADSFQYGTSVKCGYDVDGKAVLRIPNVVGGHVDPADLKFGKPKKNELGKLALKRGDLLFVRTNGVKENAGRCSKFNGELADCYFASYLIRVRLDPAILNPDFLNEYSRTEVGTSFLSGKAIRTADGKFNINSGTLKTMLVPVPAIEEQAEIARTLALLDDKTNNALLKNTSLQDLFRTLLHELMTAKTRVHKLDFTV